MSAAVAMFLVDTCDYCRTDFAPDSSERACTACGAPRSSWNGYAPPSSSSAPTAAIDLPPHVYLLTSNVTVPPNASCSIIVTPPEVVIVAHAEVGTPCPEVIFLTSIDHGQGNLHDSPAPLTSELVRARLRSALRGRILMPCQGARITLSNRSCTLVPASVVIAVGTPWTECAR